jgi:hypothetical protein
MLGSYLRIGVLSSPRVTFSGKCWCNFRYKHSPSCIETQNAKTSGTLLPCTVSESASPQFHRGDLVIGYLVRMLHEEVPKVDEKKQLPRYLSVSAHTSDLCSA